MFDSIAYAATTPIFSINVLKVHSILCDIHVIRILPQTPPLFVICHDCASIVCTTFCNCTQWSEARFAMQNFGYFYCMALLNMSCIPDESLCMPKTPLLVKFTLKWIHYEYKAPHLVKFTLKWRAFFNSHIDASIPRVPYYCTWVLPSTDNKLPNHEWLTDDKRILLSGKGTFYFMGVEVPWQKGYYYITWSHTSHNLTGHPFHWGGDKGTIHYLPSWYLIQSLS